VSSLVQLTASAAGIATAEQADYASVIDLGFCDDIRVRGIMRFTDESAVVLDCKRMLNDVLQKLQQNMIARPKTDA